MQLQSLNTLFFTILNQLLIPLLSQQTKMGFHLLFFIFLPLSVVQSFGQDASPFTEQSIYVDVSVKEIVFSSKRIKNSDEDAFHLFTHGQSGQLLINQKWHDAKEIADWIKIENLLDSHTHLNLYGCNFAKRRKRACRC